MKTNFSGVIDRFEGNFAVVLIGEEQEEKIEIPKTLLPLGAKESDFISFSVKLSPDKTKNAKEKVSKMIEKLKKENS